MTPDQYWNSLTVVQQSYLKSLVLKKNLPVYLGAGLVLVAAAYFAGKKGWV